MKTKDIKVGHDYVWARFGKEPSRYDLKVTVVETQVGREEQRSSMSGRPLPPKVIRDCVRVTSDSFEGREHVIRARDIRGTWDEHQEWLDFQNMQDRAREEQRNRCRDAAQVLKSYGFASNVTHHDTLSLSPTVAKQIADVIAAFNVHADDVETLTEAAREMGF